MRSPRRSGRLFDVLGTLRTLGVLVAAGSSATGCATLFRSSTVPVHVESDPTMASVMVRDRAPVETPAQVPIPRRGTTVVTVQKTGYAEHRGTPRRRVNGGWVAFDIATCAIPVLLCIPLLTDALTGAWFDIDPNYRAKLEPAVLAGPAGTIGAVLPSSPPKSSASGNAGGASAGVAASPRIEMSESERKATARAAYMEGIELQGKNDCAGALPRFEAAQKLFDAPTHLQHIAQCDLALGKLVEAQEAYETLTRVNLAANAPEVFRDAQHEANTALPGLRARVPSMRIQLAPSPSSLQQLVVRINGSVVPNEILGIARPVNPNRYRIVVQAAGYRGTQLDVDVREGEAKTADVKLTR
jgi:hypothetical protein